MAKKLHFALITLLLILHNSNALPEAKPDEFDMENLEDILQNLDEIDKKTFSEEDNDDGREPAVARGNWARDWPEAPDACYHKVCAWGQECHTDQNGAAYCACMDRCPPIVVMKDMRQRRELTGQTWKQLFNAAQRDDHLRHVYPVIWKFCELDTKPHDKIVSKHELIPITAPVIPMESCIKPFLLGCDKDHDGNISLKEWGNCLGLHPDEIVEHC